MKKLLSSLLCFAMVLGLTACGDAGREDKSTLYAAQGGDIEIMDPAIVDDSVTANVLNQMYEGLYKLDQNGNPVANVATGDAEVSGTVSGCHVPGKHTRPFHCVCVDHQSAAHKGTDGLPYTV